MSDNPSLDGLPEETQAYIRSLRTESARYRTERNDLRDKYNDVNAKYTEAGTLLSQANTKIDQFATLESTAEQNARRAAELEQAQAKSLVAWKAGLTPEDVDRIKGEKPEEWEADAKTLAERLGGARPRPLPKDGAAPEGNGTPVPKSNPIRDAFAKAGLVPGAE